MRPRHSAPRRWAGIGLLVVLVSLIVGYAYVTDAGRVRAQAEAYLARLAGGPVTVERARLSLFEGLRLDGVSVRLPDDTGDNEGPIFSARSVRIDYDPIRLLGGHLEATRVVAVDPTVRLVEDVANGTWNFQSLRRRPRGDSKFRPPDVLPEVLLRNARLEYARRFGPALIPRGRVGVEAQLVPESVETQGKYRFSVQTRGLAGDADADDAGPGPRAGGTVDLRGETLTARLDDVDFAALRDVLPRAVGDLLSRHGLGGRLDVPEFKLDWSRLVEVRGPGGAVERLPSFRVVVQLADATVRGLPEQWLSPEEVAARRWLSTRLADLRTRLDENSRLDSAVVEVIDGLTLRPVRLSNVSGGFVFTESGITIDGLVGDLEGNTLRVDGTAGGYSPDAPLKLIVQDNGTPLTIPRELPYLASLPRQIREVHDRFLPVGRAKLRLELTRPAADSDGTPARPVVTGRVDVLDGHFALDRLPYPVRNARGTLLLRHDDETGYDQLLLQNLGGNGIAGGPNADAELLVNGLVAPLTSVAGFDITVTGRDLKYEPALLAALPEPARKGIEQFDTRLHGKGTNIDGDGPAPPLDFSGNFAAQVSRPVGRNQRWDFRVDLFLDSVSGALAGFPYPVRDATAEVQVFTDHLRVVRAKVERPAIGGGVTTAQVAGTAAWGPLPGREDVPLADRRLRLDFSVVAANVDTGPATVAALPDGVADRLRSLGIGGRAEAVAARVYTDADGELDFDATLDVADGRFWPDTGAFNLSDVAGRIRVTPDLLTLTDLAGKRGDADVLVNGTIGLADDGRSDLALKAENLQLDAAVYGLLPPAAQAQWDALRPSGAADVTAAIAGPTALLAGAPDSDEAFATTAPATQPTQAKVDQIVYDVTLRPQGLSLRPDVFPYDLQDVRGSVRVTPGRVTISEITATHAVENAAPATLALSGTGEIGAGVDGGDVFLLSPKLTDAPIDDDLLAALPPAMAETVRGLDASGRVSVDFGVLRVTTNPQSDTPDIAFKATAALAGATLNVGVPLSNVDGRADFAGSYENGTLHELSGNFAAATFAASGRDGGDLRGRFQMPAGSGVVSFSDVAADVAGGQFGGDVTLTLGETDADPTRFRVGMAVRGADVKRLLGDAAGQNGQDFGGDLTARLDLEGAVGQPNDRRGRGEVLVEGRNLYNLPLVLGLLEVTNLSLPLARPFREATASFAIDGPRVVFEQIRVAAADMEMTGEGRLDFDSQQVDLTFTTRSRNIASIPLIGDIVGMARDELLRLRIRGTLKEPEVSAGTLPTFTSTVDEVFRK